MMQNFNAEKFGRRAFTVAALFGASMLSSCEPEPEPQPDPIPMNLNGKAFRMSTNTLAQNSQGVWALRDSWFDFTDEATGKDYTMRVSPVKEPYKNATVTVSNTEIIRDETVVEPYGPNVDTRNNDKVIVTVMMDDGRKVTVSADENTPYDIYPGHFKHTEKMLKPEGREDLKALVKGAFEQYTEKPIEAAIKEKVSAPIPK